MFLHTYGFLQAPGVHWVVVGHPGLTLFIVVTWAHLVAFKDGGRGKGLSCNLTSLIHPVFQLRGMNEIKLVLILTTSKPIN